MASRAELQGDLEFHKAAKTALQQAYIAIANGGVQSYTIGSRSLTKFDLEKISEEISSHQKAISELEAALRCGSRRRAVGVVIRDW